MAAARPLPRSISRSRAAARMAPSPGACSIACSRTNASRSKAISGTSAGALNAVVLRLGLARAAAPAAAGGRSTTLWREIAALARFSPLRAGGLTQMAADFTAQLLSPYQLNPLGPQSAAPDPRPAGRFRAAAHRPARSRCSSPRPICAPARARIFRNRRADHRRGPRLGLPAAAAPGGRRSTAQPTGTAASPPTRRSSLLVEACRARDLLLVQINPTARRTGCRGPPRDIRNRIAEIVFGRPLADGARAAGRTTPAAPARRSRWWSRARRRLARHRLHLIDGGAVLAGLDPGTKIDPTGRCCSTCANAAGRRRTRGCGPPSRGNARPRVRSGR